MASYNNPFFNYIPSPPAAIALTVVFFTLTSLHIALLTYTKRLFALPFILGGAAEFAGYIARTVSCYDLDNLHSYTAQSVTILCAPILLNGAIHIFFGQVIAASTFNRYSILRPIFISNILCWGDAFGMLFQVWGTIKLIDPDDEDEIRWSNNIICGGLALQVAVTLTFFIFASVFHSRMRKHNVISLTKPRLRFSLSMYTMYLASILTLIRTIFRMIQYAQGDPGYFMQHEWPAFAFDAGCMGFLMCIGILWYGADLDVPEEPNTERQLDVPLDRLASVSHADAVQIKSKFDGRIGQRTVITV
ncbi:RTA1 like protein-domain-containing protein [Elsinoe ampelina]|uniref:RTA1 like protein-domain-containing protein n=1 Tax=Elsinoe ampelina TaxID=302913 RepID=A0A6A6GPN2_9PEZI|nr:RTA1 like protein-domain-containing protein [Elsinoe ampelina]